MATREFLRNLVTAAGPSGYETEAARVWREYCSDFATEVLADHLGSSTARVAGTQNGLRLVIVGHIDEIGLHVTHIDEDGYLHVGGVGGWDAVVLVGQRVRVATRNGSVPGVIGRKPIHLIKDEDKKQAVELKQLRIDVGAKNGEEARKVVRIGDVAVIDDEPLELPNGRFVSRAGVPTGLVSVPLRYMHSPVEMVEFDDVAAAAQLIAGFARKLEPGMSFER
jgi:putative aminopeptidase FrvX